MNERTIIRLRDFTPVSEGSVETPTGESVDVDAEEVCKSFQSRLNSTDKADSDFTVITVNDIPSDDDDEGDEKSAGVRAFGYYGSEYRVQKYVGVISDGKYQINIGSRFDRSENQYFLQHVFATAFDEKGKIFEKMSISGSTQAIWDFLLLLQFFRQLKKAMRKGMFRKYRQFSYNDSNVKGQIDIARHIKENAMLSNGRIAYNTREYTVNNYYNMLFLRAFDKMQKKYPHAIKSFIANSSDIKSAIAFLKNGNPEYGSVSDRALLRETDRKIVHSVYRSYEQLRVTSRIILRRLGVNTYSGDRGRLSGVLIDITKLWEIYLKKTVLQDFEEQCEFSILGGKRTLKPDFLMQEKGIVLDAKYKPIWEDTLRGDWSSNTVREDVFQVMAYMLSLECRHGGIVFPCMDADKVTRFYNENSWPERLSVFPAALSANHKDDDRLFFRLPFYIPDTDNGKSFSQYESEIKESANTTRQRLEEKLNKPNNTDT